MAYIDIERIRKGWHYFWNLKASEFGPAHKVYLTEFLKLLKPIVDEKKDTQEIIEEIFDS